MAQKESVKADEFGKVTLQLPEGTQEFTLYNGVKTPLPELAPKTIRLKGELRTPWTYFKNRLKHDLIDPKNCIFEVSRATLKSKLTVNPNGPYVDEIVGETSLNPEIFSEDTDISWTINTGKTWHFKTLREFIRFHRYHFAEKEDQARLIGLLENMNSKVTKEYESLNNRTGNKKEAMEVVIETTLKDSNLVFTLKMPIFTGSNKKSEFEVRMLPCENGGVPGFMLESADLPEMVEEQTESIFQDMERLFAENEVCVLNID